MFTSKGLFIFRRYHGVLLLTLQLLKFVKLYGSYGIERVINGSEACTNFACWPHCKLPKNIKSLKCSATTGFFVEERSLVKKFEWKRTDYLLHPGHKLKGDRVSLFRIFPYSVEIRGNTEQKNFMPLFFHSLIFQQLLRSRRRFY